MYGEEILGSTGAHLVKKKYEGKERKGKKNEDAKKLGVEVEVRWGVGQKVVGNSLLAKP